jgi:uncharacterized protein (TIGR02270 family)
MIRTYTRPAPIADILKEHLEEAAFMYECRCRSFTDPELSWEDLLDYEARMFPHLHALALGGFDTARLLKENLTQDEDEDPGQAFVASYVYTTLELIEPMQWLIDALAQQPPHFKAIIDGMRLSTSKHLEGWLEYFIEHENPIIRTVGAEVSGYKRLTHLGSKIMSLQEDPDPFVSMTAIYALADMGTMPDNYKLKDYLENEEPSVFLKAIELLLRMGENDAIMLCREKCTEFNPEFIKKLVFYLAIAGTLEDNHIINDLIQRQPSIKTDCLLALSMCGHAGSVTFLIDHLGRIDDLDIYTAAYQGLRFLTGVDFIPQFDLDEAEQDDILEYQSFWKDWQNKNRQKLEAGFKWRRGDKISPTVLYKDLIRPGNPYRNMTYMELNMRYKCSVDFQYDQFFNIQTQQLQNVREWAKKENSRFQHGMPYYHGKKLN